MSNLFADLPAGLNLAEELVEVLIQSQHVRVERIVSTGHASPDDFWFDQEEDEWVVVVKGAVELLFEGEATPLSMKPGDHVLIRAHHKHRVVRTTPDEPTIWLAVFFRSDDSTA